MGIFSRLGTLTKSNLNDLITKAEDPKNMLNQVLLDKQQHLVEAKKSVAVAIADEKELQKQYTAELEKSKEWEGKATVAVRAGDDELARQALVRKQEHEQISSQFPCAVEDPLDGSVGWVGTMSRQIALVFLVSLVAVGCASTPDAAARSTPPTALDEVQLLVEQAETHAKQGDLTTARRRAEEALAYVKRLPDSEAEAGRLSALVQRAEPLVANGPIRFVIDDYPRALAQAKARGVLLFIDTGPAWSHWSEWMRTRVLTDERLAKEEAHFVWLSLDSDHPRNVAAKAKLAPSEAASAFVVDPKTETILIRWDGAASPEDIQGILELSRLGIEGRAGPLEMELLQADAHNAAERYAEAAEAYEKIFERAPKDWKHRTRTLVSAMIAHSGAARGVECANLALRHLVSLEPADASRLANLGIECALDAPKDTPSRREAIDALEQRLQPTVEAPPAELSDLDLSQIHRHLIRAREDVEDKPGAKKVAEQWLLVIDRIAARAPTPRARAVYDAHRFIASLTLGEWERLIPPMLATEKDVPGDFMAPLYLSSAYRWLGRFDEALAASDRSLARSYGVYRGRILSARAGLLLAKGEREMAQKVIEEAIQYVQSLNPALVGVWIMPELEQRRKQIQSP